MRKVGDLVLIYYMGKPSVYAKIEAIKPDVKEGWYQVKLLILSIPAQLVTWILKEEYIDGNTFTMGGVPIKLADISVESPLNMSKESKQRLQKKNEHEKNKKEAKKKEDTTKVIQLERHRKGK